MLIAKVTLKNRVEFWHLIRHNDGLTLINYPLDKPYRKREARWVDLNKHNVDWIRQFGEEDASD